MYRLNVKLTDTLHDRMTHYVDKTGATYVSLISIAVNQFLDEYEARETLLEKLTSLDNAGDVAALIQNFQSGNQSGNK